MDAPGWTCDCCRINSASTDQARSTRLEQTDVAEQLVTLARTDITPSPKRCSSTPPGRFFN